MGKLSRSDIESIRQSNPIDQVIGRYLPELRPSGDHLTVRCPFHDDSTPSLVVWPNTQSFYCFGCGVGGDVLEFVRRIEKVKFKEAVGLLQSGGTPSSCAAPMRHREPVPELTAEEKVILEAAVGLYGEQLRTCPQAQSWLESRGIRRETWERHRLGYSRGYELARRLKKEGLSHDVAKGLGLFGKQAETMKGRVVVPEVRKGSPCFLIGRSIDGDEPKYLGLRKPKPIYGLEGVYGRNKVVLVEGVFDWLVLLQAGYPAVAILGTRFTRRFEKDLAPFELVVILLDSDLPGRRAAHEIAKRLGPRGLLLSIPRAAKDVNDLVMRSEGLRLLAQLLGPALASLIDN